MYTVLSAVGMFVSGSLLLFCIGTWLSAELRADRRIWFWAGIACFIMAIIHIVEMLVFKVQNDWYGVVRAIAYPCVGIYLLYHARKMRLQRKK